MYNFRKWPTVVEEKLIFKAKTVLSGNFECHLELIFITILVVTSKDSFTTPGGQRLIFEALCLLAIPMLMAYAFRWLLNYAHVVNIAKCLKHNIEAKSQ